MAQDRDPPAGLSSGLQGWKAASGVGLEGITLLVALVQFIREPILSKVKHRKCPEVLCFRQSSQIVLFLSFLLGKESNISLLLLFHSISPQLLLKQDMGRTERPPAFLWISFVHS